MGRPLILPKGFDKHDFLSLMKKETYGRNRIRLLAMHHIQSGKSLKETSELVKSHRGTVQSWLQRFREFGFEGIFESKRTGAPRKLNQDQEDFVFKKIKELSESKSGECITGIELHQILSDKYNIQCSLRTVYNLVHKLGFSWITSRSTHPKSDVTKQKEYKKNLPFIEKITSKRN